MAAVSLRLVVVVVVAAAVTLSVRSAAATVTVEDACRHTKHEAYCVKVLSARPESKAAADMPALAELALSLAAESGAEAASFVRNLEKMPGGMPPECLEGCLAKFQDAVAELRRSKAALEERRDAVGAKVGVSEARADGDTCMEECQKVEGGAAPDIVDRIGELGKLCAVALALTDASMSKRP
uniref:Pectinesterase inhibitor domain-containing protein n=1 Tax=Oryza brachyantha TaxID=4533 RepID=J3LUF4_ORYBR